MAAPTDHRPGIHLLHKPVGPTSFSLVQQALAAARMANPGRPPRVCHGGTLDPFAGGLLLMLIGPATRLFDLLHEAPKVYEATVRWGSETDNGDPTGRIVVERDPSPVTVAAADRALKSMIGWQEQIPPATSAKRVGGERAYLKAQRGETVELPPSRVYLHEAVWLGHDLPVSSRLRVVVRGGYYVRALARDLGRALGCGAHLGSLDRVSIGPWVDPGPDHRARLSGRDLLPWLPSRLLSDAEIGDLRKTGSVSIERLIPPDWPLPPGFPSASPAVRGFHRDRFCFLLINESGKLRVRSPLTGGL